MRNLYLLFTKEQGGFFAWRDATEELYREAVEKGGLNVEDVTTGGIRFVPMKFVALVEEVYQHDFVLGGPRTIGAKVVAP